MEEQQTTPASTSPTPKPGRPLVRRAGLLLLIGLVLFLGGLIPMWLQATQRARERDLAQKDLQRAHLQLALASAALDARRGEYEPARQSAVSFFSGLADQLGRERDSIFTAPERKGLAPLTRERDELITLLARSDPASTDRLSALYVQYRTVVKR